MNPTRVLLTSVPRILAEIVRDAAADVPEVEMIQLVGPSVARDRIVREVERVGPDVVVLGLGQRETIEDYAKLLEVRPEIRVVAIAPDGGEVELYELQPRVTHIGNVRPEALLAVIRGPADGPLAGEGR